MKGGEVTGADAAVIVTEWDELKAFPRPEIRTAMKRPLIVDGRNLLDPETARRAGFAYEGIGRPSEPVDERVGKEATELAGALAPSVAAARAR